MKYLFWPVNYARTIQSRRGKYVYRQRTVPPKVASMEYPSLKGSIVELVGPEGVEGYAEHGIQRLTPTGNEATPSGGSEEKNSNDMQQMGSSSDNDGKTLPRPVLISQPSLDEGDARQRSSEERGSEGSPDGLYSDDDESGLLHDRRETRIGSVSSTDEDTGRNGLLSDEI